MKTPLRYGLIGCGGFGRFCLEQYRALPDIACVAVSDRDALLARNTAESFDLIALPTPEDLIARPDIDLVHLATPPFTHAPLAIAALRAGKHVLCEKPLALTLDDANEMVALSRERGLLLSVNLMMRYSPLCQAVKRLTDSGIIGSPLHGHFVNDARDEVLPPGHWFWEPALSGGIFVEHGVHFFDLFEWWFGPGVVLAAQQAARPGSEIIEHVNCTVKYRDSILTNFYHGFHQATRRDHQEWLIVFESGTLIMEEWVPTTLRLDFLATDSAADEIREIFGAGDMKRMERFSGDGRRFLSRHRPREADGRFLLTIPPAMPKMELYGLMLRGLMSDQIAAIGDPSRLRLVSESNGISSLQYAIRAQELANSVPLC